MSGLSETTAATNKKEKNTGNALLTFKQLKVLTNMYGGRVGEFNQAVKDRFGDAEHTVTIREADQWIKDVIKAREEHGPDWKSNV